jgi:hypothetical protein
LFLRFFIMTIADGITTGDRQVHPGLAGLFCQFGSHNALKQVLILPVKSLSGYCFLAHWRAGWMPVGVLAAERENGPQ